MIIDAINSVTHLKDDGVGGYAPVCFTSLIDKIISLSCNAIISLLGCNLKDICETTLRGTAISTFEEHIKYKFKS